MRHYRERKRGRQLDHAIADLKRERSVNATAVLCSNMIRKFGGIHNFCREWYSSIQSATQEKGGSKRALDSMLAIFRLIEVVNEARKPRDPTYMTDEELDAAIEATHAAQMREFVRSEQFRAMVRGVIARMSPSAVDELLDAMRSDDGE